MDVRKRPELLGAPPAQLPKRTMIKDLVGTVRTTSYELPEAKHIYGMPGARDSLGCGAVISSWVAAIPSKPNESQRSFIATNKAALKDGHITSKTQRVYALEHPDIRFKQPSGSKRSTANVPSDSGPFGALTEGQNVSIRNLIEAAYTDWDDDNQDYPNLTALEKKHRLKPPKATKASIGHGMRSNPLPPEKEPFKMKRFASIPARIQLPSSVSTATEPVENSSSGESATTPVSAEPRTEEPATD